MARTGLDCESPKLKLLVAIVGRVVAAQVELESIYVQLYIVFICKR